MRRRENPCVCGFSTMVAVLHPKRHARTLKPTFDLTSGSSLPSRLALEEARRLVEASGSRVGMERVVPVRVERSKWLFGPGHVASIAKDLQESEDEVICA